MLSLEENGTLVELDGPTEDDYCYLWASELLKGCDLVPEEPRGVAGDRCESTSQCNRPGCPECQA